MTTTTSQPKPKPKNILPKLPTSGEVQGQCSVCHDLFTIYVYRERGELRLVENHRLKWMEVGENDEKRIELIHRPDHCNGEVTLYGSLERLLPEQHATHRDIARGTIRPPAPRR